MRIAGVALKFCTMNVLIAMYNIGIGLYVERKPTFPPVFLIRPRYARPPSPRGKGLLVRWFIYTSNSDLSGRRGCRLLRITIRCTRSPMPTGPCHPEAKPKDLKPTDGLEFVLAFEILRRFAPQNDKLRQFINASNSNVFECRVSDRAFQQKCSRLKHRILQKINGSRGEISLTIFLSDGMMVS